MAIRSARHVALLCLIVVVVVTALVLAWRSATRPAPIPGADMAALLQSLVLLDEAEFPRINHERELAFPADYDSHPHYRTESWQLSGVLHDEQDRTLGLQVLLLRFALAPEPPDLPSRWASNQIHVALISLTEPEGDAVLTDWRVARGALGLAGATAPGALRVEDWVVQRAPGHGDGIHLNVHASLAEVDLRISLHSDTAPLTDRLSSNSGSGVTPPFRFYHLPRLSAEGSLHYGGENHRFGGMVSLEHAWGELPLPGGPMASDRFTLFLADGRELTLIRTRRVDGSSESSVVGLLSTGGGNPVLLSGDDLYLEAAQEWRSRASGVRYPVHWILRSPEQGLDLELIPYRNNQESSLGAWIWAGPVRVADRRGNELGSGLIQLQGYGDERIR